MRVKATPEFLAWLHGLIRDFQALVWKRLERIREYDHFGDAKYLGRKLYELRWTDGMRVYFGRIADESGRTALLLLGGDKHGQDRDIQKARAILARETARLEARRQRS